MPKRARGRSSSASDSDDNRKDGCANKKVKNTGSSIPKPARGNAKTVQQKIKTITPEIEKLITDFKNKICEAPGKWEYKEWVNSLINYLQANGHPEVQFCHLNSWIHYRHLWIVTPWCFDTRIPSKPREKPANFDAEFESKLRNNRQFAAATISSNSTVVPVPAKSMGNEEDPWKHVLELLEKGANPSEIVIAAWYVDAKLVRPLEIESEQIEKEINGILEKRKGLRATIESLPANFNFNEVLEPDEQILVSEILKKTEARKIANVNKGLIIQAPEDYDESASFIPGLGPSGRSLLCVNQYQPLLQSDELELLNTKFAQFLRAAECVRAIQTLTHGNFRENQLNEMNLASKNILIEIGRIVMQSSGSMAERKRGSTKEPGLIIVQLDSSDDEEEMRPDNNAE